MDFKNKVWDGKIRMFNPINRKLYLGLLNHLDYFCRKNNYTVEFENDLTDTNFSIETIEHKTGHGINNLVTIQEVSSNHDISLPLKDGGHVNYTLVAAIIPKQNHFVALLKSREGVFIEVNDDMKPIIVGPEEIGKAEIFIFRRINREIPVFYE